MKEIYIIGVGLIGGSFALDIKSQNNAAKIYGIDSNMSALKTAKSLGVIDAEASLEDLKHADLVIVAIPVDVTLDVLPKVLDHINDHTIIFDVGSTKEAICNKVKDHKRRRNFLATHPIAGTEFSGPEAALKGLFNNKTNIICEVEDTAFKLQEKAIHLFNDIGMRIRYMNPKAHDKHIRMYLTYLI